MMKSTSNQTRRDGRQNRLARVCAACFAIICLLLPTAYSLLPTPYSLLPVSPTTNSEGWREATAGYAYAFPRDHAAHSPYKIEWWYYTGNVETTSGRRFGYQLTFFRIGVSLAPPNPSRWAVRDLHMAHFAISDLEREEFRFFEKLNREGVGWAGAAEDVYRVWNEDWEARLADDRHLLSASDGDCAITFTLSPEKPPVLHGKDGISQKGAAAGNASHYYSLTRLRTAGSLRVGGETFEVAGWSWMDHEFGSSFLEAQQLGWDWFSLQLDDNRELMLFQLRRADGSLDPRSSGTLIEADGRAMHIASGDFTLRPLSEVWRSDASRAAYPTTWEIDLPKHDLRLTVKAAFANQELRTAGSTGVTYWEGSVVADGVNNGGKISGRGYLEMTGYSGQNMGALFQ